MATNDVPARESAINTAASAADTSNSNEIQDDCVKRTAWKSTVSAWFDAKAAYAAHPYTRATADHPYYARLEQEASELSDAEGAALDAIMETPAPDYAAVMEKMEILKAELLLSDGQYVDQLVADIRRLHAQQTWNDLMARYRAAKVDEDDYFEHVHAPLFDGDPTADTEEHERVDAALSRLANLRCNLQDALFAAEAPDGAALLWKLQCFFENEENYTWSEEAVAPLRQDVSRILGGEA